MIYELTERVDRIKKDKVKQDYNECEMYDTNLTMLLHVWKRSDTFERCGHTFQP